MKIEWPSILTALKGIYGLASTDLKAEEVVVKTSVCAVIVALYLYRSLTVASFFTLQ